MKDVKHLLQVWTKIALNVRLRDRSVKIIQYGCQMLIGYYGHKMNDELVGGLRNTRRICSTARKAFWLLKSINHIGTMNVMLEKGLMKRPLAEKFDFLEQIFLVFYYLFENQIFLSRCQLFNFREEELDLWCNISWFAGDVALFFSVGLKLNSNLTELKRIREKAQIENSTETQTELREIEARNEDLRLSFAIAVLELGVSMHYIYIWRKLRGEAGCISDGNVGLMGVASSVLIIYEGYRNAARSL